MDSAILPSFDSVRGWQRPTLVAGAIAAVEFLLLLGIGAYLLGPPIERALAGTVHSGAKAPAAHAVPRVARGQGAIAPPAVRLPPRSRMRILVLNGNGVNGAAGRAASGLRRLGYRIAAVGNATHQNYPQSVVMYAPGYRDEGLRLARDLRVRIVGPLDGMPAGALSGGELAVILGR